MVKMMGVPGEGTYPQLANNTIWVRLDTISSLKILGHCVYEFCKKKEFSQKYPKY